jgi:hypothetical protein
MGALQKGGGAEDNFLSFLVGMKAAEAKRRYNIRLAGEDKWYFYLEVTPRFAADRADFTLAQIALRQAGQPQEYTPAMLVYTEANGNKATWNIPRLACDTRLDRNLFMPPPTPTGWQLKREEVPTSRAAMNGGAGNAPQPRIMRPQGQ